MRIYTKLLEEMLEKKTNENKDTKSFAQKTEASIKKLRTRINQREEDVKIDMQLQLNTMPQLSTSTMESDEEEDGGNELRNANIQDEEHAEESVPMDTQFHLNTIRQPSTSSKQLNAEKSDVDYSHIDLNQHEEGFMVSMPLNIASQQSTPAMQMADMITDQYHAFCDSFFVANDPISRSTSHCERPREANPNIYSGANRAGSTDRRRATTEKKVDEVAKAA